MIQFKENWPARPCRAFVLLLVIGSLLPTVIRAADGIVATTNRALPGIIIRTETWKNPPTRLFIADVDLTNTNLHLHVAPGGPDPDGPGTWQTTLMEPTKIAARENFDFVINGDFFTAQGIADGEGADSKFREDAWARVEGPAVSNGKMWSVGGYTAPCLVVHANHSVNIEMVARPTADDLEVMAGNPMLMKDGVAYRHLNPLRHPRTVVGLNAARTRLVILVVEGRKPDAVGMTYSELTAEMRRLGCAAAVNFDGGGSTVMAIRNPATRKFDILNQPTDGHERPVANVLGITVDRPKAEVNSASN